MVVAFAVTLSLLAATLAPRPVDAAIDQTSTTSIRIVGVPLPGDAFAAAINDAGQVVGTSFAAPQRAFVWDGVGHPTFIEPPTGNSSGADINSSGEVVGNFNSTFAPFHWDGSTFTDLGVGDPIAIDDSSNILIRRDTPGTQDCRQPGGTGGPCSYIVTVGDPIVWAELPATPDNQAFIGADIDTSDMDTNVIGQNQAGDGSWSWDGTDYSSLPGTPLAIENGAIVGTADVAGESHAAILSPTFTNLPTLGGSSSAANGYGNGWAVGYSETSGGATHAVYWPDSDNIVDLGTLPGGTTSSANGVNSSGLIVGTSDDASGATRAVVWDPNNVFQPNFPPEIEPITFFPIGIEQPEVISVNISDPEDDPYTVEWTQFPAGAAPVGDDLVWTPSSADIGFYPATVTATQVGQTIPTTMTFSIFVLNGHSPILDPIGNRFTDIDQPLTFTATANDVDGQPLNFSLGGATSSQPRPAGAAIDPNTGVFTWTPDASQEGQHEVTVTVSDGQLTDRETFLITVGPVVIELTESIGVSDSVTIELSVLISITEGIGVGDEVAVRPQVEISITEGIGVGDDITPRLPVEISITEGIGVRDDPTVLPPVEILVTEQVGVGDAAHLVPSVFIKVTEGVGVSDDPAVRPPVQIMIDERIGVFDDPLVIGTVSIVVPEGIGVQDVVTITTIDQTSVRGPSGNPIAAAASGGSVRLRGGGFAGGSDVDVGIESDLVPITPTTADDEGNIDVTFEIPVVPAGEHTIVASGKSPQEHPHELHAPITVLAPVSISFDTSNPVSVPVDEPGGSSGSFDLTAVISQVYPDQEAGGLGSSQPDLTLQPVGPGMEIAGDCVVEDNHLANANGALILTCAFDDVEVNTYMVTTTVGGLFSGIAEDVLVVYDTSLGFATGGGWFYWPDSEDRTNFGFNMKYGKKGSKAKGNLVVIRHLPDGSSYRVKSNVIEGLSLGSNNHGNSFDWASFTGKATYQEPGWPDPVGNHQFIVYVEDHNEGNGGLDRFWIEVSDKDGLPTGLSMTRPATDQAISLGGGNLTIPHGNRNGGPR